MPATPRPSALPAALPAKPLPTPALAAVPADYVLSPRTIKWLDEIKSRTSKSYDQIILDALESELRRLGIGRGLHCSKCKRITPHLFIIAKPIANTNQQELIYQCGIPDCRHQRRWGTQVMTQL